MLSISVLFPLSNIILLKSASVDTWIWAAAWRFAVFDSTIHESRGLLPRLKPNGFFIRFVFIFTIFIAKLLLSIYSLLLRVHHINLKNSQLCLITSHFMYFVNA